MKLNSVLYVCVCIAVMNCVRQWTEVIQQTIQRGPEVVAKFVGVPATTPADSALLLLLLFVCLFVIVFPLYVFLVNAFPFCCHMGG